MPDCRLPSKLHYVIRITMRHVMVHRVMVTHHTMVAHHAMVPHAVVHWTVMLHRNGGYGSRARGECQDGDRRRKSA